MLTVNIHAAKTQLSQLVDRAAQGEEIIIARSGKPVARLVKLEGGAPRRPGALQGRITVRDDFNAPLDRDELAAFEDGAIEPGREPR